MNIFTLESYMEDENFEYYYDDYMTEGLSDAVEGVKDFVKKIITMIKEFITGLVDKFKEFIAKMDLKKKIAALKKLPASMFKKDATVEVPDIKSHKAIIKNITDGADKALDALASRNPFYIRSYESVDGEYEIGKKKLKAKEAIDYADKGAEKELDQVNQDIDKETQRLCKKMEKVIEKNPDAAPEAKGIISKVTSHFKRHATKYLAAMLIIQTIDKGIILIQNKSLISQNADLTFDNMRLKSELNMDIF